MRPYQPKIKRGVQLHHTFCGRILKYDICLLLEIQRQGKHSFGELHSQCVIQWNDQRTTQR